MKLLWIAAGWAAFGMYMLHRTSPTERVPPWFAGVFVIGLAATIIYVLFDDSHLPPRQRPPGDC